MEVDDVKRILNKSCTSFPSLKVVALNNLIPFSRGQLDGEEVFPKQSTTRLLMWFLLSEVIVCCIYFQYQTVDDNIQLA